MNYVVPGEPLHGLVHIVGDQFTHGFAESSVLLNALGV